MSLDSHPIVVEQDFKAGRAAVWKAITDKEQMCRWFFEAMVDFKPEVGFRTQFDVECQGQTYPHQWEVTEVIDETRLAYIW